MADELARVRVGGFELLGEVTFDTGFIFQETEVGGLSGLAYDASEDIYFALSDDRSQINDARFYTLEIDLEDGSLDAGDVTFVGVTTLLDPDGQPFPAESVDPEGIALSDGGTLFVSSEGDANQLIAPFVNEFSLAGQQIDALPVDDTFLPTADQSSGIRNNLAFESLTLSPDGRFLYTATENALFQDGPAATLENGSLVRIVQYDLETETAISEFVYEVEPIPNAPVPEDAFATNGLVELLAIDNDGTFLALERAFSVGVGNTVKVFQVNAQGALNVLDTPDLFREEPLDDDGEILPPGPFEIDPAVIKTEILDIEADLGIAPDNLEALAFGPTLPDGRQSLIIASDNNFNPDGQVTQFLALALDLETSPVVEPVVETPFTLDVDPTELAEPLDILLVNDDGFDAEGITILFDALVEAGFNVTLVAPQEQQSGQGTRISVEAIGQPTTVEEFAPGQFFVDATPITTVDAALDFILPEAPDLVISGINEGANIGESIAISSGTVSSATQATRENLPGIAVSAATSEDPAEQTAIFELSAEFTVDLVEQLVAAREGEESLLPEGVGLSVNIPAGIEALSGVTQTQLDETSTFEIFVGDLGVGTGGDPNGVPSLLATGNEPIAPEDITVPDSEGQNFLANFITITPVDGDFTASDDVRQALSDRVEAAPVDAVATPLNILITNDDGFDAEGIVVLSETLAAAGHNVTVVAPLEQQSGTGTSLDVELFFQPLEIVEQDISDAFDFPTFSVGGGVRTTTFAALDFVLEATPDLVISGINAGENIGPGGAVSSGTVSAAVTALLRDVPAIAVSGGLDLATFETPTETYEAGAAFIADLIADLQATQGDDTNLLPEGTGLSVNVPTRLPDGVEDIQGVAFTNASDTTPFIIEFGPVDEEGNVGLTFAPAPVPAEPDPLSEGDQFLNGFITVTPIDGDWTASPEGQAQAAALLQQPTPELFGDSDDPAIWVNPNDPAQSVVYATLKDGGLASFDLQGNVIQTILDAPFGDIRYNNTDIVYDFTGPGQIIGSDFSLDLVVASDRANDTLAIFAIDPATGLLVDATSPNIPESIFGIDDGEQTAYGLATYTSIVDGRTYAFVTQRDGAQVAQVELVPEFGPADEFFINAQVVRTLDLPVPTGDPEDSQSEGIVVDRELGVFYVALEEEVGILKFSAEPNGGDDFSVIQPIGSDALVPDIEGLTLYYGADGTGYLIASSQGDSSFSVFAREGTNEFLGSFSIGSNGDIDQVNESDGLDIINTPLGPDFPFGLLVVQDGANDPQNVVEDEEELENNSTNFKFVPVEDVANAFDVPLVLDPASFDPRNPQAQTLVNGIASGDVTQDSAVLWARSTVPGDITFEVSPDPNFAIDSADSFAVAETVTDINVPVKAFIEGLLEPNTEYFYRVTDAAGDVETGRFATAAAAGEFAGLSFGAAGDWRGEIAPYPAISNVPDLALDFFIEHGDTVYADIPSPALLNPDGTRNPQAETLEEFRLKHAEVYGTRFGENFWAELRASTAIFATIDDHEVTNDFAGGATVSSDTAGLDGASRFLEAFPEEDPNILQNDSQLYENGLQAFQEFNPLRDEFYGETGDERTAGERELYRNNTYGSDAATFILDNRSFRDEALDNPDGTSLAIDLAAGIDPETAFANFVVDVVIPFETAAFDESRTMLGQAQLDDLLQDLLEAQESGVTWKFVSVPEPFQTLGPLLGPSDRFDGYLAERTQIAEFIVENEIENVVFISADIHGTIVNNVTYQEAPGGPQLPTGIFEISTGSVGFDAPFGQSVVAGAAAGGFITPEEFEFYNSLPTIAPADVFDQNDFFTELTNNTALVPFGLDPLGLDDNLPAADGLIDAELLQGRYVAAHTYGWTQFEVDPDTQVLTVTTYGIEPYSEAELLADPDEILAREPAIVSQFAVTPQNFEAASPVGDVTTGTSGNDTLIPGIDIDAIGETILTGAGDDIIELALATGEEIGENIVLAGSGGDEISVTAGDIVFGSSGDDVLFAEESQGGNRVSGGAGNDIFFLGAGGDRFLGGSGDDTFFFGDGGSNIIAGGAGADTYILSAPGDIPTAANLIVDFEAEVDILSVPGFDFADLAFAGEDILLDGSTIATLADFAAETLTEANFA